MSPGDRERGRPELWSNIEWPAQEQVRMRNGHLQYPYVNALETCSEKD